MAGKIARQVVKATFCKFLVKYFSESGIYSRLPQSLVPVNKVLQRNVIAFWLEASQ